MKTEQNDYYSKIPNRLFYLSKDDLNKDIKKSIFKLIPDVKVLLVLYHLYLSTYRNGVSTFILDNMIVNSHMKPDHHTGRINDQFKNILFQLHENKYISSATVNIYDSKEKLYKDVEIDYKKIKPTDLISCKLNIDTNSSYVMFYDKEINQILKHDYSNKKSKTDRYKLLFYYCYLKSRMHKNEDGYDRAMCGGKSEVAYPPYKTIYDDIGLTDETIKKYNDLLIELDMIRIGNAGLWSYVGKPNIKKESQNYYTLFNGDEEKAQQELKDAINFYKSLATNSNKIFTKDRKYSYNDRKLNGIYGSLIKKQNKGNISDEELLKLREIQDAKNANEESYRVRAILEANPNSLYYQNFDNDDKSEAYYNLEIELGLINEDNVLLVDRKYYIGALCNLKSDGSNIEFIQQSISAYKQNKSNKSINICCDTSEELSEKEKDKAFNELMDNWGSSPNPFKKYDLEYTG